MYVAAALLTARWQQTTPVTTARPKTVSETAGANPRLVLLPSLTYADSTCLYFIYIGFCAALFERRKKYGVPVQMSRHPELNSYILSVLESITPWMEKGVVRSLRRGYAAVPLCITQDHIISIRSVYR